MRSAGVQPGFSTAQYRSQYRDGKWGRGTKPSITTGLSCVSTAQYRDKPNIHRALTGAHTHTHAGERWNTIGSTAVLCGTAL